MRKIICNNYSETNLWKSLPDYCNLTQEKSTGSVEILRSLQNAERCIGEQQQQQHSELFERWIYLSI